MAPLDEAVATLNRFRLSYAQSETPPDRISTFPIRAMLGNFFVELLRSELESDAPSAPIESAVAVYPIIDVEGSPEPVPASTPEAAAAEGIQTEEG